ncbi:cytochrome oxidase putative small subunit CydP [Sessilibacter sp. MAH2]
MFKNSWLTQPLVKELAVVLVIKLVVIFAIKWMFFSDPVDVKSQELGIESHLGIDKSESQPE